MNLELLKAHALKRMDTERDGAEKLKKVGVRQLGFQAVFRLHSHRRHCFLVGLAQSRSGRSLHRES